MMTGGLLSKLSGKLDRLGFRPFVAAVASATYRIRTGGRQRFFADRAGYWVNHHSEATIVSPAIHTARFDAYRELVMDNWAWQYQPSRVIRSLMSVLGWVRKLSSSRNLSARRARSSRLRRILRPFPASKGQLSGHDWKT